MKSRPPFVRIRPNTIGFKSETESGVRGAFAGIGKIIGVALGATAGYEIIKSSVEAAAVVQKSQEVIRSEFGKSAGALAQFANGFGVKFGALSTDTLAASARFGILFKNMGIGGPLAAQLTQGFEKLAISVNAIKGGGTQGAAQALQSVLLAAAGSTRGLKQLGITFSSAQLQAQAMKLGLIQTITQALTPGQKAIAIYSFATAHLGQQVRLATKHSGDFANIQAQLSARWDQAKGILGRALLPELTKLATALSHWLGKMEKSGRLQKDFNEAGKVAAAILHGISTAVHIAIGAWDLLSKALGGAKNVAIAFFAVMAVNKIRAIATSLVSSVVNAGLKVVTTELQVTAAEATAAFSTMDLAALGFAATIKGALISTGIGALVVAMGIAVELIITHWNTVKRWFVDFAKWIYHHALFIPIVGQMIWVVGEIVKHWNGLKQVFWDFVHFFGTVFTHPIRAVETLFTNLWKAVKSGLTGLVNDFVDQLNHIINAYNAVAGWLTGNIPAIGHIGTQAGKAYGDGFYKAATSSIAGIAGAIEDVAKKISKAAADGATTAARAAADSAQKVVQKVNAALQTTIDTANKAITASVQSAKNNLVTIGDDLAKTIAQIQAKLGGAAGAIAGSPQGQAFAKLKQLIESGAPSFEIARAQQALSSQLSGVGKTQAATVKGQLDNLTAAFNKGQIGYTTFENRLHEILSKNGITLKEALKAGGPAFADAFKAQVSALGQQAKAIAAVPAKYRGIGGAGGAADLKIIQPLQVIRDETVKIASAAQKQRLAQLKATETTNTILRGQNKIMRALGAGNTDGFGKQPKGKGSHDARTAAKVGSRG